MEDETQTALPGSDAEALAMAANGGGDTMIWIFVAVGVVILLLLIVAAVWLWRSRKKKAPAEDAPPPVDEDGKGDGANGEAGADIFLSPAGMKRSFHRGLGVYRDYVAGSRNLYLVPWFIGVGEVGSGKSTLFSNLERSRAPCETLDEQTGRPSGCLWWYYDNAVVLDVGGESILRADGSTVPDLAWQKFLGLLYSHRNRRPADGIILTLPAPDYFGPTRLPAADLARKARAIYSKLWHAQKVLGLCLPVYVVLTKCDTIPGFSDFASALPNARRQDILGWSSPQATDAVFVPGRVDEALRSMGTSLRRAQMELYAERRDVSAADDVFLLPHRLMELAEPLRQTLSTIFRQTAYHESLFLRGIYLTGDTGGGQVPLTAVANDWEGAMEGRALAFARDLFARKVFREVGLVRPTPRWSLKYNRQQIFIRAGLAAGAVAAVAWLWWGGNTVRGTADSFVPAIRALPTHFDSARVGRYGQPDGTVDPEVVAAMIRDYTRVAPSWDTALFPANAFSSLHQRTAIAMSIGYYKVMMEAVRTSLHRRGALLTEGTPPQGTPGVRPTQLATLNATVNELDRFEGGIALFNGIHGTTNLGGLDLLFDYALGLDLPPAFFDRAQAHSFTLPPDNALLAGVSLQHELRPFDSTVYRAAARLRVLDLAEDYFRHMASDEILTGHLSEVARDLDRLDGAFRESGTELALLRRIRSNLDAVSQYLSSRDSSWIGMTDLAFGPEMTALLSRIADNPLLGPEVRDEVVSRARVAFARVQNSAVPSARASIGPLLERDASAGRVRLSAEAESLRSLLAQWLDMPFMRAAEDTSTASRLEAEGPRVWDLDTLDGAIALTEDYLLFEAQYSNQFPAALRPVIRSVSRKQVAMGVLDSVGRAQVPYAPGNTLIRRRVETDLRVQVRSFDNAAPALLHLLQTLDHLGVPIERNRLYQGVTTQARQLLMRIDELLTSDRLYEPAGGSLSWWNGELLAPHRVFAEADPAAMIDSLETRRTRLKVLSHDLAEPLVDFFYQPLVRDGGVHVPELDLWTDILVQIDRYDDARPNSALANLEQFILEVMPQIDLTTCLDVLGSDRVATSAARGFFQGRQASLRAMLLERCNDLLDQRIVNNYETIRSAFLTHLAGAYPFGGSIERSGSQQATIDGVRSFYQAFDSRVEPLLAFLRQSDRYGIGGQEARRFLEEMQAVRQFIQPLLGQEAIAGRARYELDVAFRENRMNELNGNGIIEWTLTAGDMHVSNYDRDSRLSWLVGQPMTLRLRWARDGNQVPVRAISQFGRVSQEARTATFVHDTPWGLVSMLQQHGLGRSREADGMTRMPHLLGFELEATQGGPEGTTMPVRVYIGLSVMAVGEEGDEGQSLHRVGLPHFPASAPAILGPRTPETSPAILSPAPPPAAPLPPVPQPEPQPAAPAPQAAPVPERPAPMQLMPQPAAPTVSPPVRTGPVPQRSVPQPLLGQ